MSDTDTGESKLDEFTEKIRIQGVDGFAAGPWEEQDRIEVPRPSASLSRRNGNPVSDPRGKHTGTSSGSLGDRILTGLAILSLGMLIVGVLGAYVSSDPPHAATTTRSEPTARTPAADAGYTGLLQAVESRLASAYDSHEQRLQNLETTLLRTYDPNQQRFTHLEARLADIEARYEYRLNKLESALIQARAPYEGRIRDLETRLLQTAARLDELSAEMAPLTENRYIIMAADKTLAIAPPAALPVSVETTAPASPPTPATASPDAVVPENAPAARIEEAPAAPPSADTTDQISFPPADTAGDPATPGGAIPATEAEAETAPPSVQPTAMLLQAKPPAEENLQDTVTAAEIPPPATPRNGDWAINIASYRSERTAGRKLAEFQRKGVDAELSKATVHGKTMYRVRVPGFASRRAATDHAGFVKERLGLKDTWITKQ